MVNLPNERLRRDWVPLPLRPIIGYGLMAHGWAKWSPGPEKFAQLLDQIGVPLPEATAWFVALLEFFGGLAILVGAYVAVVSGPLIITVLVAMVTVYLSTASVPSKRSG